MEANIPLQPPGEFNFRCPDGWQKWKRRFTQYLQATGLAAGEDERKVSTLLYCIGEEGDQVLTTTNITEEERKSYATVIEKFDGYFQIRRNVIFERAKFNRRDQGEGESAEQYITCLYSLVETCNYGVLQEEMLRDRIVVGIRDKALSEKLQMDPTLTLEGAKKLVRQKEAVKEHRQELQGSSGDIDGIGRKPKKQAGTTRSDRSNPQDNRGGASDRRGSHKSSQPCIRCGKQRHESVSCTQYYLL